MCRLPAGQTTFAISNSTQPYTCTCCEINYAFNFYQMREWVLLSEWFRGRKLGKVRKEAQMGKYMYLPGSRSNFAPVIYKNNTLVSAHCWLFSIGKMWIQIHPLFYLPEVTLACLIPACVVCSQENHISCSCYGSKPSFIWMTSLLCRYLDSDFAEVWAHSSNVVHHLIRSFCWLWYFSAPSLQCGTSPVLPLLVVRVIIQGMLSAYDVIGRNCCCLSLLLIVTHCSQFMKHDISRDLFVGDQFTQHCFTYFVGTWAYFD